MRKAILILFLMIAPNLFSQDNEAQEVRIVNHQVMMGETVKMLSRKYLVPPSEIYRLNKFAVDGIKQGMVLKIPVPIKDEPVKEEPVAQETPQTTEPVPDSNPQKSTLQESVADVEKAMEEVSATAPSASGPGVSHRVASGETLSGLAQQYGTTVKAIKEANPKVAKRGLRADETIKIPSSGGVVPSNENASYESPKQTQTESGTENAAPSVGTVSHTVQPGETLFGLARKYNVSVDVIKQQNPSIAKKGLQTGQVLKITAN